MENYITEQKKAEEMYNGAEILVDLARRYPELWNEIDRQCTLNRERYGLLCEILLAGDEERCEDVVAKIYRYEYDRKTGSDWKTDIFVAAAGTEDGRNRNAVEMGFIVKEASSRQRIL